MSNPTVFSRLYPSEFRPNGDYISFVMIPLGSLSSS